MNSNVPRSDVGGGGLLGALTVLIMLVLQGDVYDFSAVSGAIAVVIVAGSAYLAGRAKSAAALVAAPVGIVVASVIGLAFGAELDKAAVSSALAAIVVAAVTYLGPATHPDDT